MSKESEVNLFINKALKNEAENINCAEKLKSYVPEEIQNSYVFKEIFKAYGDIFEKLEIDISDLFLQILPQTASEWGISLWEKRIGLTTNNSRSLMERRARVLAKLINKSTTTVRVIQDICKIYFEKSDVIQYNSEYYFELNLSTKLGVPKAIDSLYEIIEIVKPAHLRVNYKISSELKAKFYVAAGNLVGERITVYPYAFKKIEIKSQVFVPISDYLQMEKVTIYPKEGKS